MTTPNETSFLREAMDELIAEEGGTRRRQRMQLHHARPRPPYQGRDPRLREVPTERNPAMSGHIGEGLIRCHVCGAVVPSIYSLIDLPGAPEDGQPAFFPTVDATMHNPGCSYCHDPETMEYLNRFSEDVSTGRIRNAISSRSASCSTASTAS